MCSVAQPKQAQKDERVLEQRTGKYYCEIKQKKNSTVLIT